MMLYSASRLVMRASIVAIAAIAARTRVGQAGILTFVRLRYHATGSRQVRDPCWGRDVLTQKRQFNCFRMGPSAGHFQGGFSHFSRAGIVAESNSSTSSAYL